MICNLTDKPMLLNVYQDKAFLVVENSQKERVEKILQENGLVGEWSVSGTVVETYSDYNKGLGAGVWSLFLSDKADFDRFQSLLDTEV